MRRLLLFFFVFLVAGVALSLVFREQNGYVLIAYGSWRFETSLFFFIAALVLLFWALVALWRIVVGGLLLPAKIRKLRARRRERKAQKSLHDGLMRLYAGRWNKAENELVRQAEKRDDATLNYLSAARASQHQNAIDRRDRYLERASDQSKSTELVVLLTQAELQLAAGQDAEALASLTRLRELEPSHPHVLLLLANLCERLDDWLQVRDLLPALRKSEVVSDARWTELAVGAWRHALQNTETNIEALNATWRQIPRGLRDEPALQQTYCTRLHAAGGDDTAADLIKNTLKKRWDPMLVQIFGDLEVDGEADQLATVETWIKRYGEEPELQLVAGRLCLRNRLWGRARSYLESSLRGASRPQALLELGRLFEHIDQTDDARQAYRQGLEHLISNAN